MEERGECVVLLNPYTLGGGSIPYPRSIENSRAYRYFADKPFLRFAPYLHLAKGMESLPYHLVSALSHIRT